VDGTPIVATQFHPELAKQDNIDRYLRYWEEYGSGDPGADPVMRSMAESPDASALLPRWAAQLTRKEGHLSLANESGLRS